MGMFLNYQNLAKNYTPNNIINEFKTPQSYTKLDPSVASKPYENYDAKGNLDGYTWMYGDGLNLEFNIDGEITVETDAIIYKSAGLYPSVRTPAKVNQRAYNVIDLKSWTCVCADNNEYTWKEDLEFSYPLGADKSVYVGAQDYLKDKQLIFCIYNFRMEEIYRQGFEGGPKVIVPITPELSKKLVRGIYYCSLTAVSDTTSETIFESHDCKLLVK